MRPIAVAVAAYRACVSATAKALRSWVLASPDSFLELATEPSVRFFQTFDAHFAAAIQRLSDSLCIGGRGFDVELDEICFRSLARAHGVVWVRFLAAVRRGSSLVWIHKLPYRITDSGKGGGGPISDEELDDALLIWSDEPRLVPGSVCHTDGAKAYRSLAAPLYDGCWLQYEGLHLGHTCVKHKPPHPEFTKKKGFNSGLDRCTLPGRNPMGRHPETRWILCRVSTCCWQEAVQHGRPDR